MQVFFDHEKLRVYQESVAFVAWCDDLLGLCPSGAAARDHLDRASTSIPSNIAQGNGKRSIGDRDRFFDVASGSALECAACLDVLVAKRCLDQRLAHQGKERLQGVVTMLIGLTRSFTDRVGEEAEPYGVAQASGSNTGPAEKVYFSHEKLRVYQEALGFVAWAHRIVEQGSVQAAMKSRLDRAATSIALNIAEANGKRTTKDRARFFHIASASALSCAACVDVLVAKGHLGPARVRQGKVHLRQIVSMLFGLMGAPAERKKRRDYE